MSCSLPHTAEEITVYVKKQCEIDDAARQQVIIAVTKLFNEAYMAKQALREQYAECKDIPQERRVVVGKFLFGESMKDYKNAYNSERRFYCCSKRVSNCGFADRYDPPMYERAVQIIHGHGLLRSMNDRQASLSQIR
nr:zinc finger, GRF-type [Tanacetum cinerariifolium]GEX06568.1 zinc finger, GRF-type [Tanacetum cinerariifolium]